MSRILYLFTLVAVAFCIAREQQNPTGANIFPKISGQVYFAVSVVDLDKAVQWYERTLGLKRMEEQRAQDGTWRIVNLTSNDVWVELIWDQRDQVVQGARGIVKVGFSVGNVEEVARHVESLGAPRPRIVDVASHKIRVVQLTDPDGNILQFISPM